MEKAMVQDTVWDIFWTSMKDRTVLALELVLSSSCNQFHYSYYLFQVHNKAALKSSMTVSNEPGYYAEGQYGIRIENIVLVREVKTPNNFDNKEYLGFEHVTLWVGYTYLLKRVTHDFQKVSYAQETHRYQPSIRRRKEMGRWLSCWDLGEIVTSVNKWHQSFGMVEAWNFASVIAWIVTGSKTYSI